MQVLDEIYLNGLSVYSILVMKWLKNNNAFKIFALEIRLLGYSISNEELANHFVKSYNFLAFSFQNYGLPVIPKSIFNFTSLRALNLKSNNIDRIFDDIGRLEKLNILNLANNRIVELPYSFEKLIYLEDLDLSNNDFDSIYIDFSKYSHLAIFKAGRNNLKKLPPGLGECSSLEELDLSMNRIQNIDKIGHLSKLTSLKLNNNKISIIPDSFAKLHKIETLDISSNNITKIPDLILSSIHKYKYFNASDNNLQAIINNVDNKVFEEIILNHETDFAHIDDNLPELFDYISRDTLAKLYLELRLFRINVSIIDVAGLFTIYDDDTLEVNFNNLDLYYFPSTIAAIDRIDSLRMPLMLLNSLPTDMRNLSKVKKLRCWNSIDDNSFFLTELPSTICRFPYLEELNLWFNKLKIIPDFIGNLTNLKRIILAYNDLKSLPQSIKRLDNLEFLDVRGMDKLNITFNKNSKLVIKKD